ncbi:MAG: VWA domain-containing protein [Bacteroidetes bacterium]|nr:VWA domain-containing protein [Bacteroidota bacterium]
MTDDQNVPNAMPHNEEIPDVPEVQTFHQLGILLLDGSNSMNAIGDGNRSHAENVNFAVREFLGYFKNKSSIKENFSIAVICFGIDTKVHTDITKLTLIDDFADYNPTSAGVDGNGTFIGGALKAAQNLAITFLNNPNASNLPHDVRFIVMSDGLDQSPEETKQISEELKQCSKIMVCSSLFAVSGNISDSDTKEAKSILSEIASTPNLYKTTYGEADLRQFFISSMSAKRHSEKQNGNGLCPVCNTFHS